MMHPWHKGSQDFEQRRTTKIKSGLLIGALMGAIAFLAFGYLNYVRAISVPFLPSPTDPAMRLTLVAAGVLFGTSFGALSGALVGIGTPAPASERLGGYVVNGGILMSVHIDSSEQGRLAISALEKIGAQDVSILEEDQGWKVVCSQVSKERLVKSI